MALHPYREKSLALTSIFLRELRNHQLRISKNFHRFAPASRSNSIPLRTFSYSTKLLVHGAVILMEKEYVAPRGETNRIPTPHPSSQADPSKNIAQARINTAAISVLIMSATRSASAYPLTAFAGWYRISNSDNANIHFPSRPFRTGADSMCFMTSDLHITIVSAESKI